MPLLASPGVYDLHCQLLTCRSMCEIWTMAMQSLPRPRLGARSPREARLPSQRALVLAGRRQDSRLRRQTGPQTQVCTRVTIFPHSKSLCLAKQWTLEHNAAPLKFVRKTVGESMSAGAADTGPEDVGIKGIQRMQRNVQSAARKTSRTEYLMSCGQHGPYRMDRVSRMADFFAQHSACM